MRGVGDPGRVADMMVFGFVIGNPGYDLGIESAL